MVGILYEMTLSTKEEKKHVTWCLATTDITDLLKLPVNLTCLSTRSKNSFRNTCSFYANFTFRKIHEKGKESLDFSTLGNLITYSPNANAC